MLTVTCCFYTGSQAQFKDSSRVASSVRLAATPLPRSIELRWQANVPWDNTGQTHKIYRITNRNEAQPVLLADVPVTGAGSFRYVDSGLSENEEYCYKVRPSGSTAQCPLPGPCATSRRSSARRPWTRSGPARRN